MFATSAFIVLGTMLGSANTQATTVLGDDYPLAFDTECTVMSPLLTQTCQCPEGMKFQKDGMEYLGDGYIRIWGVCTSGPGKFGAV
jgi:hypothetical protein